MRKRVETEQGRSEGTVECPELPDAGIPLEELRVEVEELVRRERPVLPGIILRARMLETILDRGKIHIDASDPFTGHIESGELMQHYQQVWIAEVREENAQNLPPEGVEKARLDLSHTAPDWKNVLKYGPRGIALRAENAQKTARDFEAGNFYLAVRIVFEAVCRYCLRLSRESMRAGAMETAEMFRRIAERPPETFHEALQWAFLFTQVQEMEGEYIRSQGTFDQLFVEYYRRDLASGRLTRERAGELLRLLFNKYADLHFGAGHNFCLGGSDESGRSLCNELTELCLEVFRERGMIDPKLSLRCFPGMPESVLLNACEAIREGSTAIVFANDESARKMFRKNGKKEEEIRDFIPIGCYEPSIMGKELCCSMSVVLDLASPIPRLMSSLEFPESMDEVVQKYRELLKEHIRRFTDAACFWKRKWKDINPSPLLSGTMDACFQKGRDVSNGGAEYSVSGVVCAGLGTAADSLAALDYAVFQHRLCSWRELRDILSENWKGHEDLRQELRNRAPKWGCNDPVADFYGKAIADFAASVIHRTPNDPEGYFQAGFWSIDLFLPMGKVLGATPDGRVSGEPISKNAGASAGMAKRGIPALLHSTAKLDASLLGDGAVVDVTLHPSTVDSENGAAVIASLIRTFFDLGGFLIHFNIFDSKTLKDAQIFPEKYKDLQVRVCGWNALFSDLSKEMQDSFIRESEGLEA